MFRRSRSRQPLQRVFSSQAFWVTVALVVLYAGMAMYEVSFGTVDNFANMTRNFAPFGIMALGMTVVIITGGIDLSIGSIMGAVAIVTGLFLSAEYPWYVAFFMGLAAGLACGAINGFFVAYVGLSSFVVTLGMMSVARSFAVVLSGNQMLYKFGPDAPIVKAIGQAKWPRQHPGIQSPIGYRNFRHISGPWSCWHSLSAMFSFSRRGAATFLPSAAMKRPPASQVFP